MMDCAVCTLYKQKQTLYVTIPLAAKKYNTIILRNMCFPVKQQRLHRPATANALFPLPKSYLSIYSV